MLLKVFSIFDSKASAFMPMFCHQSTGTAIRDFESVCRNPESKFNQHPEDFTLFELGSWDDFNAQFEAHAAPVPVSLAVSVLSKPDKAA